MDTNKQLNEQDLEKVTGGDYGDSELEGADWADEVTYLYNINQEVEVYDNCFHTTTEHGTIIARRAKYVVGQKGFGGCRYVGEYQIHYVDGDTFSHTQDEWVVANQIER